MNETNNVKRITVFGGSRCKADAPEYQEALQLGRLLVEAGFQVCSGGYSGVMEAISKGAHDVDGHVVGMTMNQFRTAPNPYITKAVPNRDFYERLQSLILESVGYVALRGGMGTVTEVSLVWNKLVTGVLPKRPLVLLGSCWPRAMACLREHLVVSDEDMDYLCFVDTAEEALEVLKRSYV